MIRSRGQTFCLPNPSSARTDRPWRGGEAARFLLNLRQRQPATAGAHGEIAQVTRPLSPSHDLYDLYDPLTTTQRQQRTLPRPQATNSHRQDDRSSTPSSHRVLRRTPRFQASPSPRPSEQQRSIHIAAATVGISPRPLFATAGGPSESGQDKRVPDSPGQLSQDLSDNLEEASALPPSFAPQRAPASAVIKPEPHPFVRLSRHTRGAILWALEEALRNPYPFSPDLVEENASMADLLGGATSNGNGASSSRPTAPPMQTGSPQQVIRGPRMIMRERAEREARQRAEREREQMEHARAEEEARLLEEARRRAAERRAPAAGAVPVGGGAAGVGGGEMPLDLATQRRQQRAQEAQGASRVQPSMPPTSQQPAAMPAPLRPTRVPTSSQAPQGPTAVPQPGLVNSAPAQAGESSGQGTSSARIKNSFPHAFERWEALSAHWEGMTSFWIRKLQENTEELDRNPISAQLSRQVGDLSAAGANLFHAVVELQRLRASSERKFQRWFLETRLELERHQEVNAMLAAQMQEERRGRSDAIRDAVNQERESSKTQKLLAEMRKELLISKEEARRAWEELGRREQEERDRTVSLQQGVPTIVGGVQVVPMTQGVPSRHTSAREHRSQNQADTSDYVAAQASHYPQYTQAPPVQHGTTTAGGPSGGGSSGGGSYYQQPETTGHETGSYGAGSEAGYSEEDYETPASQSATSYPPSSSQWANTYSGAPEYSGQGYAAPGWETMPRHHHPTRLSDVIEEDDERSRTSASQVSRA
ncbi:hypothetical protein QBC46DRAFT_423378 [Diplogelasinospora grovesii]|uniref:Uncharacterized protein n=1 Tax=Diplogelasinospora grovesii TaxID=303347 RepID=A0AAN6RZU6_9PEZI|nr:hypothetical protein QBC46DRAFT_423378 [Diplogelasinospora grovesii]